jgi:ADP-ribosylglycohydrolase
MITHNSPDAIAGSIAVALMIYSIKNNISFDSKYLPDSIVKEKIDKLDSMMHLSLEDGLLELGTKFDVRETVPSVLFALKKSPNYDGMVRLIKNGGDCDTNASIFGCMLAALKYELPEFSKELKEYKEIIELDNEFNLLLDSMNLI